MKLLTFEFEGHEKAGVVAGDGKSVFPIDKFDCMYDIIENASKEDMLDILELSKKPEGPYRIDSIKKMAPIPFPKQDIICLGINYMAHAEESARFKEEAFGGERPFAVYFSKRVSAAVEDGGIIDGHFHIVDSLDYECELAVIIGKDALNVSVENAKDYIFGYTVLNDISARNLQTAHKQWYFGKSLDSFCPMGPWIVTADEITYPPNLSIKTKVNGSLRQDSRTDLLIFGISHIISELSQGIKLKAGTIIASGTPSGVGMGMLPPVWLKSGDKIECEIEGIGKITNFVK